MPRLAKTSRVFNGKRYVRRGEYDNQIRANQAKARWHGKGINALTIKTSTNKFVVWVRIPRKETR